MIEPSINKKCEDHIHGSISKDRQERKTRKVAVEAFKDVYHYQTMKDKNKNHKPNVFYTESQL